MKSAKEQEWQVRPVEKSFGRPQFWHYVVLKPALLFSKVDEIFQASLERCIESLCNHEFTRGNHIEKMYGTEANTIRINSADRLIFSLVDCHGVKIALIHSYILKHKLEENRILFSKATISAAEDIFRSQFSHYFESISLKEKFSETISIDALPDIKHSIVIHDHHITLEPLQSLSLEKKLPIMHSGPGGSGKTLMLIIRVIEHAKRFDERVSIAIITNTKPLTEHIKNILNDIGCLSSDIQVVDYTDWILEYAEKNCTVVGDDHFTEWFRTFTKITALNRKSVDNKMFDSEKIIHFAENISLLFQMMKYLSGLKEEEYAERQAIFRDAKKELYYIYHSYLHHLETKKLLHPAFYKIPDSFHKTPKFSLVAIDEAQNLTLQQIENLIFQARFISEKHRSVVLNFDSHQAINSCYSHRAHMMSRLGIGELNHTVFETVCRSPKPILELTNHFIQQIKYPLLGGLTDRYEAPVLKSVDTHESSDDASIESWWRWLKTPNECEDLEIISPNWLIITHEDHIHEARALFLNACLFSEVIGLEFSHVCLYKPFSHQEFLSIEKELSHSPLTTTPVHEAKSASKNRAYMPILNQIISAMLRTTQYLVIIQDEHHIKNIYQRLNASLENIQKKIPVIKPQTSSIFKQLEWFWLNGNQAYVQRCFENSNAAELLDVDYDGFVAKIQAGISKQQTPQPITQTTLFPSEKTLQKKRIETLPQKSIDKKQPSEKYQKSVSNSKEKPEVTHEEKDVQFFEKTLGEYFESLRSYVAVTKDSPRYPKIKTALDMLFFSSKDSFMSASRWIMSYYGVELITIIFFYHYYSGYLKVYFEEEPEKLEWLHQTHIDLYKNNTLEHVFVVAGDSFMLNLFFEHGWIQPNRCNQDGDSPLSLAFKYLNLGYLYAYKKKIGSIRKEDIIQQKILNDSCGFNLLSEETLTSFNNHTGNPEDWHPFNGYQNGEFFKTIGLRSAEKFHASLTPEKTRLKLGDLGLEPLHIAIETCNFYAVLSLLSKGANPNAVSAKNETPLSIAIKAGFESIIPVLLHYGADPYFHPNKETMNAIQISIFYARSLCIFQFHRCGVLSEEAIDIIQSNKVLRQEYKSICSINRYKKHFESNISKALFAQYTIELFQEIIHPNNSQLLFYNFSICKEKMHLDKLAEDPELFKTVINRLTTTQLLSYARDIVVNGFDNVVNYLVRRGNKKCLKILITRLGNPVAFLSEIEKNAFDVAIETKQVEMIKLLMQYVEEIFPHFYTGCQAIVYDNVQDFSENLCLKIQRETIPHRYDKVMQQLLNLMILFNRPHFLTTSFKASLPEFLIDECQAFEKNHVERDESYSLSLR